MTLASSEQPPIGTARAPRSEHLWTKNCCHRLTLDEALEFAAAHGVDVPEYVRFFVSDDVQPDDAYAAYGRMPPEGRLGWDDLVNKRTGAVPVKVRPYVLDSPEAVVAVFAHEVYELRALRRHLGDRTISRQELGTLIAVDGDKNFHGRAWDDGDARVEAMGER